MKFYFVLLVIFVLATIPQLAVAQQSNSQAGLEKKAWLGVATSEVPRTLREYLELKEGFGIQITHIPEHAPAAKAGLKPGDVLMKFNDQLLISPLHLAILVRGQEKGDTIELTYLRKGSEKVSSVILEEKEVQPLVAILEQNSRPRVSRDVSELIARYYGGADRVPSHYQVGGPKVAVGAVVRIDNENGEAKLYTAEGQRMIEIFRNDGVMIHKGPFDKQRGIDGLPEDARKQLELMKVKKLESLFPK